MQIIGIDFCFRCPHRIRPATKRRDNRFHFQITTFYQPHFQWRTAISHTRFGKVQQFSLKFIRIGQISLYNNTCRIVFKFRSAQHFFKQAQCKVSIFILLHIQIDKLGTFYTILIYVRKINRFLI